MPALPPFQQLIDRHSVDVLGYLTAMVGPVEAEDCFQETFLAALRAYPGLRDAANLRGWLFTIAHRKALDSLRHERRMPRPAGQPDELVAMAEAITGAAFAMSGEPAGREAGMPGGAVAGLDGGHLVDTDSAPESGEVWETVAELPPKQRAAVTLRFTADLSHRDIATALDCSVPAARRSLHEGLTKLREAWT